MANWQKFFHNKRKQNTQDEKFCPWPSNNSGNKEDKMKKSELYIRTQITKGNYLTLTLSVPLETFQNGLETWQII